MRVVKLKRTRRILDFYRRLYDLKEPYRVLVDGSFAYCATRQGINIVEQVAKLFENKTHTYVTACILDELEKMGSEFAATLLVLKRLQILKCNHVKNDKPSNSRRCILACVKDGNHRGLFVASQDKTLIAWLRRAGDIPIVKLSKNNMLLERPSSQALEVSKKVQSDKMKPKDWELKLLESTKEADLTQKKKKRRGPKEPNPLSCLKKRKKSQSNNGNVSKVKGARKRSRRRINVSVGTTACTDGGDPNANKGDLSAPSGSGGSLADSL